MLLEGVFAAITTPFYPDERVYFRKLEANVAHYSRSLLAGMMVLGSTGEAASLNDEESREVLRTAAEAAAANKVLIAGVGQNSVRATLEMADAAAKFDYDAVLVRLPPYYASVMTTGTMLEFFCNVADRSPLPVVLYNIPRFVPAQIPVEVAAEMARHPNVIGMKESSGQMERITALIAATKDAPKRQTSVTTIFEAVTGRMLKQQPKEPGQPHGFVAAAELSGVAMAAVAPLPTLKTRTRDVGFQVLSGSVSTFLESLEAGATGAVLAFGACAPQACQEIYLAWKDRDHALARAKQERVAEAASEIVGGLGISGVKYACDFNGYFGGRARQPLPALTAAQKQRVEELLAGTRN
ncbi:MAG TPA: dihydrodipicolinate synthase family protein [Terracidiphilus sp.]|nr:dihydrodipicolinate synthase family protein [Terracidiphilus sp.]